MPNVRWMLFFLLMPILLPVAGWAQAPSCEEQLAEVQTTLSFVRASRQTSEETAGRVTATLQKRLDAVLKEVEALKKRPPHSATDTPPEPQKDTSP